MPYYGNPHGLLYTGDPDLPLEDSYPFIGMAGMGLGGLLTRAAMKTPVRSLIRKEPTLPKVTVKKKAKKKTSISPKRRLKRHRSKQSDRSLNRYDESNIEMGSRDPSDWRELVVGTLKKGDQNYSSDFLHPKRYFTKGEQRTIAKRVRKKLADGTLWDY